MPAVADIPNDLEPVKSAPIPNDLTPVSAAPSIPDDLQPEAPPTQDLGNFPAQVVGDVVKGAKVSAARLIPRAVSAAADVVGTVTPGWKHPMRTAAEVVRRAPFPVPGAGWSSEKFSESEMPTSIAGTVGAMGAQALPTVAAGFVPIVGKPLAGAVGAIQQGSETHERVLQTLRAQGKDEDYAHGVAALAGGGGAVVGGVAGVIAPGAGGRVSQTLIDAAIQGTGAEVAQMAVESGATGQPMDAQRAAIGGVVNTTLAGGMRGVAEGVQRIAGPPVAAGRTAGIPSDLRPVPPSDAANVQPRGNVPTDLIPTLPEPLARVPATLPRPALQEPSTIDQPPKRPGGALRSRVGSPSWEADMQQNDPVAWRVWASELGSGPEQSRQQLAGVPEKTIQAARERLLSMYETEGTQAPNVFRSQPPVEAPAQPQPEPAAVVTAKSPRATPQADPNINPRYAAYLRTTDSPSNVDYMSFISKMDNAFRKASGYDSYRPIGHDPGFTPFIEQQVESTLAPAGQYQPPATFKPAADVEPVVGKEAGIQKGDTVFYEKSNGDRISAEVLVGQPGESVLIRNENGIQRHLDVTDIVEHRTAQAAPIAEKDTSPRLRGMTEDEFVAKAMKQAPSQGEEYYRYSFVQQLLAGEHPANKPQADPFAGEKFRLVNRESGSGDQTPPKPAAPTQVAKLQPKSSQPDPRVVAFKKQAESLTKKAEERSRPMTQNATPKRMREYNSRRTEGAILDRAAKAFAAMADAREAGTLPKSLEAVRTKAQVLDLVRKKTKTNGGYYDAYYELPEFQDTTPAGKALQNLIEPKSAAQRERDTAQTKATEIQNLEAKIRFVKIPGFFPTPKPLADKMASAANIRTGDKVLEPSAGKGDLADAIKAKHPDASIETIETVPDLQTLLKAKGYNVAGEDFLAHTGQYDRIVMNPPFERGADMDHVQHAWEQLKPGGKLVALMSEGTFFNNSSKAREFRNWLGERDATSEKIASGAFTGAEAFRQTGVASRMVTIEKPSARESAFVPPEAEGKRPAGRRGMAAFGKDTAPPREQFTDPEVEKRYREAGGVKTDPILMRIKEGAGAIKDSFTRSRIYLDTKQPADAKLDNTLRLREAEQAAAPGIAKQMIESYVKDLDLTEYDRFGRMLVLPDIVKDIEAGRYEGKSLPFGFRDRAQIESEMSRIESAATPKLKAALARRQAEQKQITEKLVDLELLPESVLDDDRYYHRQVMEYMGQRESVGLGGKGVKLGKRGFQKQRVGGGDFNTRYEQAEHEYLTHALRQIATKETLARVEADHDIAPRLRKQFGEDWQDHIPDDHSLWSPKIGTSFAAVQTIPEAVASKVIAGSRELAESDLREMFARVPGKQLVIPKHFADQLDHMPVREEGALGQLNAAALASWKQWTLLSPMRAIRYNLNNMSGDLDVALAGDPRILAGLKDAWRDLSATNKGKASPVITKDIRQAQKLGVIGSGENLNEIPDISDTGVFRNLTRGNSNPIKWYWEKVRGFSTFRENLVRLSAFRHAKKLIAAGKEPLWASKPSELKAIKDPNERAAKLSRDLIGDYGNISEAGQTIRRRYIPFYSWMEINAPRYLRLFQNAARPGEKARVIGAGGAKAALKLGALTIRAGALYSLVHLFNKAVFPGEDDGFEDGRLRLLIGKSSSGRTMGIRFQGAFSDALSWANLDDAPGTIGKVRRGDMSAGDVATEIGKAPINKLVGAALPLQKTIAEAATGKSMFPDVFGPRPIRDRGEHVARSLGVDPFYRAAKDIPQDNPALGLIAQGSDPGENAYRQVRGHVHDWLEKNRIERGSGEPTDRSNALYYMKSAQAKGNIEQAKRWRKKYFELGGTAEGMKASIDKANPIASIPMNRRQQYLKQLSPEQRQKVIRAMEWYRKVYRGEKKAA